MNVYLNNSTVTSYKKDETSQKCPFNNVCVSSKCHPDGAVYALII